jgi:hypothetical protein
VITAKAGRSEFKVKSVFHGKLAVPPMIAKVSIKAVGANAVKNVDCTVFEPFLKEKLKIFLKPEAIDPIKVFFSDFTPSYLTLSIMCGV